MTGPLYDEIAADIRRRAVGAGSLFLVHLGRRGESLLATSVEEGTTHVDELFVRHLADLIDHVDAPRVVVAVVRDGVRPVRADRTIYRNLSRTVQPPDRLAGLLIVGPTDHHVVTARRSMHAAA